MILDGICLGSIPDCRHENANSVRPHKKGPYPKSRFSVELNARVATARPTRCYSSRKHLFMPHRGVPRERLEGLISKRSGSRYEAGRRTRAWVKIKLY
jgi:hypothetical protein